MTASGSEMSATDEELLDFEAEIDGPPPDQDHADQLLRALAALQRRRGDFMAVAQLRLQELEERIGEVVGPIDQRIADIERALGQYHAAVLVLDPHATTIPLPHGTLKSRGGGVSWEITDEEKLRAWLKENRPKLLKPQEPPEAKLDKNGMKQALKEGAVVDRKKGGQVPLDDDGAVVDPLTGDKVPGLKVVAKDTSYSIG